MRLVSASVPPRAAVVLLAAAAGEPRLPTQEYFDEYGLLYDHIGMLQDHVRMAAYYDAIRLNAERDFKGKVVLDVGAGTGVLSLWAARAGASRVYAVEATAVAAHAEKLVSSHGFDGVVRVLRGRMEEIELPEKVDVIVSEWMGYFLLRESMVESVLFARDRWLAPGGVMYPSQARLLLAPMAEAGFVEAREADVSESMAAWDALSEVLASRYELQLGALRESYAAENIEYGFGTAWQGPLPSHARVGEPTVLLDVDMHSVTHDELFGWERTIELDGGAPVHMLCGWFDVRFCARGSGEGGDDAEEGGAGECVELSTAPTSAYTHWAHTALALDPPLAGGRTVSVGLAQSSRSHHDLNVTLQYESADGVPAASSYSITAEFRQQDRSAQREDAYDSDEDDEVME